MKGVKKMQRNSPVKTIKKEKVVMKKRVVSLMMAAVLGLSLTACSGGGEQKVADGEWKWERNIEIICPWGNRRRSRYNIAAVCNSAGERSRCKSCSK